MELYFFCLVVFLDIKVMSFERLAFQFRSFFSLSLQNLDPLQITFILNYLFRVCILEKDIQLSASDKAWL